MNTVSKLRMSGLSAIALVASFFVASPAPAADYFYGISATFTPIGTDPNIQWGTGFGGTFSSIYTPGVANFLVDLADTTGVVLEDLPATLVLNGYFGSTRSSPLPYVYFNFSLVYAGADPLVVQGNTFNAGAHLIDAYAQSFLDASGNGGFAADGGGYTSSGVLNQPAPIRHDGIYFNFSPPPETYLVHYRYGDYPFTLGSTSLFSGSLRSGGAPEPTTWILFIGGFGLAGAMLRRQRILQGV